MDLSPRRGELTLLMGPSGGGKTTLLLVPDCMLTPTSGTVTVCGAPRLMRTRKRLQKSGATIPDRPLTGNNL
ncbi:MAG: ATP-binding cassette domain-containing protein [Bradyrhizobium sp.]|nr:ATP-binding cassette domain-containing protein [Bradyrhizobium sp.]